MKLLPLLLLFAAPVFAQDRLPDYGTIEDIKGMTKLYVTASDDDSRTTIVDLLKGYSGVTLVNRSQDADFILEYSTLTRDVAANSGPGAMGASKHEKSQMRAYVSRPDGSKLIAWTETETLDVTNGMVFGAPNETNLTHHFVKALQKARNEETYSLRKLYSESQKVKKQEKKKSKG